MALRKTNSPSIIYVMEDTAKVLTNTAVKTALFQDVIAAGTLGKAKRMQFKLSGTVVNTGLLTITPSISFEVALGSTVWTLLTGAAFRLGNSTFNFTLTGEIATLDDPVRQIVILDLDGVTTNKVSLITDATVATGSLQLFRISAQYGAASTASTITVKDAYYRI